MRTMMTFAIGAATLLLALASPVLALELGPGSNEGIPQNLEAVRGNNVLTAAVGEVSGDSELLFGVGSELAFARFDAQPFEDGIAGPETLAALQNPTWGSYFTLGSVGGKLVLSVCLLEDLDKRPVCDAFAVGEAATAHGSPPVRREELGDQP